jgi:hypothetical protein
LNCSNDFAYHKYLYDSYFCWNVNIFKKMLTFIEIKDSILVMGLKKGDRT